MRVIASSDVYTIVETRTELMLHHRSRKWNGGISKVMTAPHVVARTSSNNGGTSMAKAYLIVLSSIMDFCLELLRCVTFEKFNRMRLLRQSNINFCLFVFLWGFSPARNTISEIVRYIYRNGDNNKISRINEKRGGKQG